MIEAGELCQACRHEVAEALRRAAAEREQGRPAGRHRLQESAEAERQLLIALETAEARRHEEEAQKDLTSFGTAVGDADPYSILGVPTGVTREELRAAYERARAKYDASLVAHLSDELQERYRVKAEAVERAYRTLNHAV